MRTPPRLILSALALAGALAWAREGRAEPPDSRFGLVPVVGGGIAGLTAAGSLPGFIGYTSLGAEVFGQLRTWGLFLRFDFLSSGNVEAQKFGDTVYSGWNAYSFDAGVSYRLFGDSHKIALFARGALTFEHWVGQNKGACSVLPFVPDGCDSPGESYSGFEGEAIGVNAGARLEIPLDRFYVAFGASFVPLVTVSTTDETANGSSPGTAMQPGDVFQLRLDLAVGLRDTRGDHTATHDPNDYRLLNH
jgi:hypothetical protein